MFHKAIELSFGEGTSLDVQFQDGKVKRYAQLVDRIEIRKNVDYEISIHFRMTAEQFLGRKTEASA